MNVLHATKVQGVGGAEQHLLTLLPALRARGIDARFLSLDAGGDAPRFHRALDEHRIPWESVPCGHDASPKLTADVVSAVRRQSPDLVHTHMVHADIHGSIAAHVLRIPFVSTRHNDDRYLLGPFRYVDRLAMHGVRRIVTISDAVRTFHIRAGLPASRLLTIHYGLDELPQAPSELTPADAGIGLGTPLVLAIGRLIPQKDHATLLAAFARVRDRLPAARLAILGWGPLEAATKQRVAALRLEESVLIPGRVEPRAWLEQAHVFAHTSRWEGFGLVLLEAMLAELPIVATKVSAVPEIVVDGQTGLLAEAGDSDALAEHLSALLTDERRRAAMGTAGAARARAEFSVARMTDRTIEVYREAVEQ